MSNAFSVSLKENDGKIRFAHNIKEKSDDDHTDEENTDENSNEQRHLLMHQRLSKHVRIFCTIMFFFHEMLF